MLAMRTDKNRVNKWTFGKLSCTLKTRINHNHKLHELRASSQLRHRSYRKENQLCASFNQYICPIRLTEVETALQQYNNKELYLSRLFMLLNRGAIGSSLRPQSCVAFHFVQTKCCNNSLAFQLPGVSWNLDNTTKCIVLSWWQKTINDYTIQSVETHTSIASL
jgi:hypothetical protein